MRKILSLITPLYNTPINYLEELKEQLIPYSEQTEWVLVNDSPFNEELVGYVEKLKIDQKFIKVHTNKKNLGIYKSYVAGYELASGVYCGILDHDDHMDLRAVLACLEKEDDYDLLYSNEYKFDEQRKFDFFDKPELDILSAAFYFYSHHITLMKTAIVKRVIKERSLGKYSSIFDICLMLDYINEFRNSEMKVAHIDSFSYGWRVHQNSTALNIDQKPTAHMERIKKTEEFFKSFGETPIVSIDQSIQYLVCSEFFSGHDLYNIPLTNNREGIERWFGSLSNDKNVSWFGNQPVAFERIIEVLNIIHRLPFKYLEEYTTLPTIIVPKCCYKHLESDPSYQKHLSNVPFILKRDLNFAMKNLNGLIVKTNPDINESQVNIIVIK
ncbi:Glycosyltransferase involved in cell wall bisynthesis [Paenibacillus sp. cl141a]|uniref:glycosyltransferase n=1 Tax=Paenibacillus sp. cl141a TaxID=1761877 RepID=UPI0008D7E733|nr:glycosyltransferase [Paenibacillus sp. cl141a]SEL34246.1 Glycosyltransferase involved in cell wall bisynthesis [Paenibacillus sp. cl141a]